MTDNLAKLSDNEPLIHPLVEKYIEFVNQLVEENER